MKPMCRKSHNTLIMIALILSIIGIIAINLLYQIETQSVIAERDEQLFSLAYSVDSNLVQKLEELASELDYTTRRADYKRAESNLEIQEDSKFITDFLIRSHLFEEPSLEGIVIQDSSDQQIYALNQNNLSTDYQYTFVADSDGDDLFVCYDQYGKYSIAMENYSNNMAFRYYVLVDLNHFYDTIVPEELQETHWVVFFEPESGLLLQNHDNQDAWMVLTEEEITDRNDGYSIILKNQKNGTMGAETYMYPNYHQKNVPERIVTLPRSMTKNGYFAIGISRDSEQLYDNLRRNRNLMLVFMILLLIGGIIITRYIFLYRQRVIEAQVAMEAQMQEKALLEARMKEEELVKALEEAQMQNSIHQLQPHFLYNALSSIREIVLESPDYAADLLLDFTNFLRACLRAMSTKGLIPFEQELKNIEAYVSIEKMRLGNRLTVEYDIQEKDFDIIPLGVQPLVENAIRHGISKKRNKTGIVKISTLRAEEYIEVRVEDNGIGFDVNKIHAEIESGERDSTGIQNLALRYENNMNAKLEGESEIGKGTRALIRIPIENMQILSGGFDESSNC